MLMRSAASIPARTPAQTPGISAAPPVVASRGNISGMAKTLGLFASDAWKAASASSDRPAAASSEPLSDSAA